ncbi:hypothetical protein DV092_10050 [Clostridium botulinum]|uniref:hypothetical protein n=1 Tax=unclassified Clostridium TaxID=2614128 RepID=UPI00207A4065|nr:MULTISPECIES: hypothetical protein [unclassified Clostridium]MBN1052376.1 hypothetical protein [Clostridium botulinum]
MKKYNFTMLLTISLFVIGIIEFLMLSINIKVPHTIVIISTTVLFCIGLSDAIKNRGFKTVLYPLIVCYFIVGIPIAGKLISNNALYITIVISSFIIAMMFLYNDLVKSNKEKLK